MEHIDVILFLAIVIIILGCWIIVLYANKGTKSNYEVWQEDLGVKNLQLLQENESLKKQIKENQERFENDYTQLLNRQQLKPIPEMSWGQKEFEHYKSKQK